MNATASGMNEVKYEQHFYGRTQEQARLLREGRFAELDVTNVVEEIETLGRGERRERVAHLRVLLTHLLKRVRQPHWRGRSGRLAIEVQRLPVRQHALVHSALSRDTRQRGGHRSGSRRNR
jgi:Domain of unknown function DUF29